MVYTAERNKHRCCSDPKPVVTSVQMDPYTYLKSHLQINIQCHREFSDLILQLCRVACNADKNCKEVMALDGLYIKSIQ